MEHVACYRPDNLEVFAKLFSYGSARTYKDESGRTFYEIDEEPEFYNFYYVNEDGDEEIPSQEIVDYVTEIMEQEYWAKHHPDDR